MAKPPPASSGSDAARAAVPSQERSAGRDEVILVAEPVAVFAMGLSRMLQSVRPAARVEQIAVDSPDEVRAGEPQVVADVLVIGPTLAAAPHPGHDGWPWRHRRTSGVALCAAIDTARPGDYAALLGAGVRVLWDLTGDPATLARALDAASRGYPHVCESLAPLLVGGLSQHLGDQQAARAWALTPREQEILELLALGRSNREISEGLFISENTVKNHVRSILDKTQAKSRTEAVSRAARTGLVRL